VELAALAASERAASERAAPGLAAMAAMAASDLAATDRARVAKALTKLTSCKARETGLFAVGPLAFDLEPRCDLAQ
jgi:hypothetical protein